MQFRTVFPHDVVETPDLGIVLPDGCRLSARVWMPEGAEAHPVPAILEYLPYRKRDGTIARDQLTHPWFAGHGYACLRVDMRGNGDSEGLMADEYTPQELQDACDVIAWIRAQSWCSGEVGMMGISWGGFNSLQVAALRPEGLKAIITLCSTVDRFADDIHYKGGCQLGENLGWAAQMLSYSSRPPDPAIVGDRWKDMWLDRLRSQPFHLTEWLRHQRRDDYWKHGSVCEDYSAIKAAVLSIGGWHDGYRNTMSHLVSNISAPVKGIAGPWNHKYPHIARPDPAIGFCQEALRWWDRWLKGQATVVEDDPAMRLWLMDAVRPKAWLEARPGRWIAEPSWPAPSSREEVWHLTDAGLAVDPAALSGTVASPADCGAAGGEYFPYAFGPELPLDQRPDDALSRCFDGPVSEAPLDIVGAPMLRIRLASDKPVAQLAVRLCDVFPDGTSALISLGVLNLCHHRSHAAPEALTPGQTIDVSIPLDQIAYRIPEGHRLRVALSTAYWPYLWPAPESVTLHLESGHLHLPLRPLADGDEWAFDPPEAATPWAHRELRAPTMSRRREVDLATGRSVLCVDTDHGEMEDLDHGLVTGSTTEERWSIQADNPQSAAGEIAWKMVMRRGAFSVRTACDASLRCDHDTFFLHARIRAWDGAELAFEKAFDQSIKRDLM